MTIMEAIRSVRNIRTEKNVPPSRKAKLIFVTEAGRADVIEEGKTYFERLAGASEITIQADRAGIPQDAVAAVIPGFEIYIPLEDLIDIEKELERLEKEKANLQKELDRVNSKLNNEGFVAKAPAKLIEEEKAKQAKYSEMYEKVIERLASLKK
jgi:valyl-tRNA synthetase